MLQAWMSVGYIVLLAVLLLAFILWRRGSPLLPIAALAVGIPLWFGWEYARPTWTTGVITGTEVRRSDPDARHANPSHHPLRLLLTSLIAQMLLLTLLLTPRLLLLTRPHLTRDDVSAMSKGAEPTCAISCDKSGLSHESHRTGNSEKPCAHLSEISMAVCSRVRV